MAFLFKSKKNQNATGSGIAQGSKRDIHTSDGTSSPSGMVPNGAPAGNSLKTSTPSSSVNNSLNSLAGASNSPENPSLLQQQPVQQQPPTQQPPPPGQWDRRPRADSESQRAPMSNFQQPPPQTTQISQPQTNPNAALYPWSQRRLNFTSPQANPFPRYGAAVNAVASKQGDIYLMGGLIDGQVVKGDLWIVEAGAGSLTCYPVAPDSDGPGPRVGHASLLVGNAFIVFGGDTKMDEKDTLDDTLYLLNTSSKQWSRASPPGPRPPGRYGHTLNILGSKIYIFGGQVEGYFFNDLLAFDLNALQNPTNRWEFLNANSQDNTTPTGPIPPARTNHTVVSYGDQLFLFGGTNGVQWFNDVWAFSPHTNTWTLQDCIGYIPAPREGHAAAIVNDVMYVFGGRTEEGQDLGDLAAFRITTRRWYTFQNMGPSPSPRSGHSMTAFGKQIVVLAGEPSSAPRDPSELSLVYILDTGKIRYPNDQPAAASQSLEKTRRPSAGEKSGIGQSRGPSAQGQNDQPRRAASTSRESVIARPPQRTNTDPALAQPQQQPQPGIGSRLPRASIAQAPAGPPPPGQAPTPKQNGVIPSNQRSKTPEAVRRTVAPQVETVKAMEPVIAGRQSPSTRGSPKETKATSGRDGSPASLGRRTPTSQHSKLAAKAMEAGEAAPLARQRSLRSQRQQSVDSVNASVDEPTLGRSEPPALEHRGSRGSRGYADEPRSPRLTPHQEALTRELEAAKGKIAWYAAELALAKKAGYQPPSPTTPESKDMNGVSDEDRALVESFMMMRNELSKMHATLEQQMSAAAKRVAEVEQQRDTAVNEAAFSRAKLAAYGGSSQRGTPQPDEDSSSDRATDVSRRLALALAAQSEHKSKLEALIAEVQAEKRAREIAEETAEAAQRRLTEVDQRANSLELDGLKAELHEVQKFAREAAGQRAEAETSLQLLKVDKDDLQRSLEELTQSTKNHHGTLAALHTAVSSSSDKANVLEKQLQIEKQLRQEIEQKLVDAKADQDRHAAELATAQRQLQDAEELVETHANEANTHREALLAGLTSAAATRAFSPSSGDTQGKIKILETQLEQAQALVKSNQEAANVASEKLRRAEERIAGLEAYQEQSSREGLQLRRQLQAAMKDAQTLGLENKELKSMVESNQREASALTVQHGALKDLLDERGPEARRGSPMGEGGSRHGSPEVTRMRELEEQLQVSLKAHEDTKSSFESRELETDRAFREKLEQLEADYQSAVHYVKGTEKMLKRMKDELAKYKTANVGLRTELDVAQKAVGEQSASQASAQSAEWEAEKATLQQSIADIQAKTTASITQLETQLAEVHAELEAAKRERDESMGHLESTRNDLELAVQQSRADLEQMKSENHLLESRAVDAEGKVTLLLDQVEASVGNYRRQSQLMQQQPPGGLVGGANGFHPSHNRNTSASSTATGNSVTRARGMSDATDGSDNTIGLENRGSMALDSLANELDALRSHWESTNRSYRLSNQFDFEKPATDTGNRGIDTSVGSVAGGNRMNVTSPISPTGSDYFGVGGNNGLAEWRRKLDEEERVKAASPSAASLQQPAQQSRSTPSPQIMIQTSTSTTTHSAAADSPTAQQHVRSATSPFGTTTTTISTSSSPSSPTFSRTGGGLASPASMRGSPSPIGLRSGEKTTTITAGPGVEKISPSSPTITGLGNMI